LATDSQFTTLQGAGTGSVSPFWTPQQLADRWQVDASFVRKILRDVPGILRLGDGKHATIRVPAAVLERYEQERSR
jgi:hypothetical protein